ncbi:TPA: hypothetical protein SFZ51_001028 [Campylobacter jejuni]|nr:hypothetical protein [Campylobacter jejuni]HEG8104723.1 hypothetical protein [Campylobacter jejuni]HEG8133611.1 hypothetical protein [Campylobacter jejuni]
MAFNKANEDITTAAIEVLGRTVSVSNVAFDDSGEVVGLVGVNDDFIPLNPAQADSLKKLLNDIGKSR